MPELNISTHDGALVVSSEAIADGSGVQHKNVLELIIANLPDFAEFGQVAFETRPGYNNAPVRIVLLNEQQATLLMTFQRNTPQVRAFKKALVRAFFEMARQVPPSLSEDQIVQQALTILVAKTAALESKIAADAPKVSAWDELVSSAGTWSYQDVAHALQSNKGIKIGEKRLVNVLVDWRMLFRDHKNRPHAYQDKLEQGLFEEKFRTYTDMLTGERKQSSAPQVRITGKGIDEIYRRLSASHLVAVNS
jgi:anti-repressor protein